MVNNCDKKWKKIKCFQLISQIILIISNFIKELSLSYATKKVFCFNHRLLFMNDLASTLPSTYFERQVNDC